MDTNPNGGRVDEKLASRVFQGSACNYSAPCKGEDIIRQWAKELSPPGQALRAHVQRNMCPEMMRYKIQGGIYEVFLPKMFKPKTQQALRFNFLFTRNIENG